MHAPAHLVGRTIEELPRLGRHSGIRHRNIVTSLNSAKILPHLLLGQDKTVTDSELGTVLPGKQSTRITDVDYCILRRANRLSRKQVNDSRYGMGLKLLIGVKLQLHGITPCNITRTGWVEKIRSIT
jgi:hypothetical protein